MSGYGNSRHARRAKPMSKATQCAEALQAHFIVQCRNKRRGPLHKAPVDEIADFILRFYPEEQGLNIRDYCIICNHSIDDCHSFALNYPNKWMESHTVSHPGCTYQEEEPTNSLKFIDTGKDE